jgi:hypothetical protein
VRGRAPGFLVQRSLWSRIGSAIKSAATAIAEVGRDALNAFVEKVAAWAREIPGYDLLALVLGRDPIADRPVERTATNLIHAVVGLIPGGQGLWADLERTKALQRAGELFSGEIEKLDLSWQSIRALFHKAWEELGVGDLLNPSAGWAKIRRIFGPPLARLVAFAIRSGRKIAELVFEGALALAGGGAQRVLAIVRRAGAVFSLIVADPIRFVGNLAAAVKGGFARFRANIRDHLRAGIFGWLTGALRGAVALPSRFDFRGILSIVLQVLGLTYQRIREKLVRQLGEPAVRFLEGAFELLRAIVAEGPIAAWRKIMEFASNLADTVLAGIREWVVSRVVVAAVTKLATMFNPAGAVIQAVIGIYDTVMFFVERAQQIAALLDAVVGSISNIARGAIGPAVAYVERTMARGLTVAIGFLARLVGLGGVAARVRRIIARIQAVVDRALDRVIGFIVDRGRALLGGKQRQAPPEAAAQGAAAVPAKESLYEEPEGGHTIRVLPDLSVVRQSKPQPVTGSRAQKARQKALEKLVGGRKQVKYPSDGDRARGPYGHVHDVKVGGKRWPMSYKRNPGYLPGDHRGHLIGDRFYGPPTGNNLVPMHRTLNLSTFKSFEDEVARRYVELKAKGQAVLLWMKVIPNYLSSARPGGKAWYRPTTVTAKAKVIWLKRGGRKGEKRVEPGPLKNPRP